LTKLADTHSKMDSSEGKEGKLNHKRSPHSWICVLSSIMDKTRRLWPINVRPVDADHGGDPAGAKSERTKELLDLYNRRCTGGTDRIENDTTLNGYLNEALIIGRTVKDHHETTKDHPELPLQDFTESNEEYRSRILNLPFGEHPMDFALRIPLDGLAKKPEMLVDFKNLKVKNPSLTGYSDAKKQEFRREIASWLLNFAVEQDRPPSFADDVEDMNLDQWEEYVRQTREATKKKEHDLMNGAGANHAPGEYYCCCLYFLSYAVSS